MRRNTLIYIVYITAAIISAIYPACFSHAQEYSYTPIKVSEEKVRVDGKTFYSHIVMERQTIYGISKAYGVSIEDIYRHNPSVKEHGLKKNAVILIPIQEQRQARLDSLTSIITKEKTQSIQPLRVHIKKWYETIEDIAAAYGVSPEAILKANSLKGKKIGKRAKLVIPPSDGYVPPTQTHETGTEQSDTLKAITRTDTTSAKPAGFIPKTEIKASLLLPLKAIDSTSSRNHMDFYSGVLMAVNDMVEQGTDVNLSVHDIGWSMNDVSSSEIEQNDFVIGPISTSDISSLITAIPNAKAVISPLDPRAESLTDIYECLIQAPTPQKTQFKDLVRWILEDIEDGDKVVFIKENGARLTDSEAMMTNALEASSIPFGTFSYSILEGREIIDPLTALMSLENTNRVIVASDSEAFVNDVVRNLNLLVYNQMDIVLYAPSKIRSYETIEVENLHNLRTHVSMSYYIDYQDKEVMNFLMKYRALFNMEPNQFAYQGYDVAKYFMSLCAEYGDDWKQMLEKSDRGMLQATFMLRRNGGQGYVNHGTRRIIYENGWEIRNASEKPQP